MNLGPEQKARLNALISEFGREAVARMLRAATMPRDRAGESMLPPLLFLDHDDYAGAKATLWPEVKRAVVELCEGDYDEGVMMGGIGTAKTTVALYAQLYQLYWLTCLENPHRFFELDPASEIMVVFQSLTGATAKSVDFDRFAEMVRKSPYFARHFPPDPKIRSQLVFPNRIIVKPITGEETGAIGQNVIGGLIDEINFMKVVANSSKAADGGVYDQAMQNYRAIVRRRQSRFMKFGKLPGLLCMVSSARYPGEFTERKRDEAAREIAETGSTRTYIYDRRAWEVNPTRFGEKRFRVFAGSLTHKPRILEDGEEVAPEHEDLVYEVPEEYRRTFESDMSAAIRDILGVSTLAMMPFITSREAIAAAFDTGRVSVLSRDETNFKTSQLQIFPKLFTDRKRPRWVHLDYSSTGDSTGVSCGYVSGFAKMRRTADAVAQDGKVHRAGVVELWPVITLDFLLEVTPPPDDEVNYEKIRTLLYKLREAGLPIKWVSSDQYQSTDTLQILRAQGFVTGKVSLDRTTGPYDVLKTAIIDRRLQAPECEKAMVELMRLEKTSTGKIDHPPNGSKDIADCVAGVTWGLTTQIETWVSHGVDPSKVPEEVLAAVRQSSTEEVSSV